MVKGLNHSGKVCHEILGAEYCWPPIVHGRDVLGKSWCLGFTRLFFFNQKNSPINSVSHEFLKCSYIEESIGITYHLVSNKKLFLEILMISIYSTHETSYSLKQVLHNFLLKAKGVARKKYDSSPPSHCLFTCSFCAFGLLSSSRRVHGELTPPFSSTGCVCQAPVGFCLAGILFVHKWLLCTYRVFLGKA